MKNSPDQTGAVFTGLPLIINTSGNVRRVFKSKPDNKLAFSEIYFSELNPKSIKAWKHHSLQTQNISVAFGRVRVICVIEKPLGKVFGVFDMNSEGCHGVLTIPNGIYYALINQTDEPVILINATDIVHNPEESHTLPKNHPDFEHLLKEYTIYK